MQALTMASGHHESHGSGYGQDSWIGLGHYSQPGPPISVSPMHEYPNFDYGNSPIPMEPAYAMPRPPPYVSVHHPLPPPLVMPHNGVWPSMLASQNSYQPPILPANPIHTPISAGTTHSDTTPTSAKSASRRKLTDEERRQMCLEAEQNPTMKQTQIGAKFNVERSTVSKILRQKEKYMKPQSKDEVASPGKKSKVRLPDVEKTLANWARNQQRKGNNITDEELRKQAVMFSAGRSDQQFLSGSSWLEKFKQKHLEGKGDSNAVISDAAFESSPGSSNGLFSPSMSTMDDHPTILTKLETLENISEFDNRGLTYDEHTPLHHDLHTDMDASSEAVLSPVSPELSRGDGLALSLVDHSNLALNFARQRSQTFHHLTEASSLARSPLQKPNTPILPVRPIVSNSQNVTRETSIDPRRMMKRHKSVPDIHDAGVVRFSSMQPPPLPRSAEVSPVSNPTLPSAQDENIKALYSIKQLLEQRPDVAEPDDYVMIGKLLEKLKLLRSATATPSLSSSLNTMDISQSPRISKKRTILGISS